MINLLPEEVKKENTKSYRYRLVTVAGILVAIALGILSVVLGSFFTILEFEQSQLERTARQHISDDELQANIAALRAVHAKLKLLNRELTAVVPTAFLDRIVELKNENITISKISLSHSADGTKASVAGRADDRKSLLSFKDALLADPLVAAVETPKSILGLSENITFTADITIHMEEE